MEERRWVPLCVHNNKCMSGFEEGLEDDSETAAAPELTETTDLDTHLANDSVPRRRRPAAIERDRERASEHDQRTRSSSRAPLEDLLVWPAPGPVTRATGPTSMAPKLATTGVTVPPVLVPLADKQYEVMQMSVEQAAAYAAKLRDVFNLVKNQGHFPLPPNKQGLSHSAMQDVQSLVNVLTTYHMLGLESKGKAQLLVQAAFGAELRLVWNRAWNKAPVSTTGHGEGSQLFCAFRNLLVAFTTIAEKQRILDTKSAFRYFARRL